MDMRHEHDCACCTYLGQHEQYDLHYCGRGRPTVIARFGPDGDYLSGMDFAIDGSIPVLTEALHRAIKQKLVTVKVLDNATK
jgi:hypothetical protein